MKALLIAVSLLSLGACAKPTQAPIDTRPIIPIQLVNVEKTVIVAVPPMPSDKQMSRISKNDRADKALATTLDYTKRLKTYATVVTTQLFECKTEIDDRNERLKQIKQYVILNQGRPVN